MKKVIAIILGLTILISCKKESIKNCKLSNGDIKTEQRVISEFTNILLKDNVNLILNRSNNSILEVEAGSNLISGIITVVNEHGTLEIRNNNECDWARDYNTPVNVYLNYTEIDTIEYRSIGNISTTDTILTDTLWIRVMEGAGKIDIAIDVVRLYCELHYGTADIVLNGKCGLSFVYSSSFGLVDLRDLPTPIVFVTSRSSNNVFINATSTLGASIVNIGDIYYRGNPQNVTLDKTGAGNLIKLSN